MTTNPEVTNKNIRQTELGGKDIMIVSMALTNRGQFPRGVQLGKK